MPTFQYKGYNSDGIETAGSVEASRRNDAVAAIKDKQIFPTYVMEVVKQPGRGLFRTRDETFLPDMTRHLAMLLSSGIQLREALHSLSAEYPGFYRKLLTDMGERISGGTSLHRALEDYGNIFPAYYINMVQAGEASGSLSMVLIKIADFLERQASIKAKMRSAMVYPVLMVGVSAIVLFFLFSFVMPKIVRIFSETKGSLPFITILLIAITDIIAKYWWAIIAACLIAIGFLKRLFRKSRHQVDRYILKLPGGIIQSLYYARFARTMGVLLDGGIPVLKALKLSAKSIGNRELESSVMDTVEKVAAGQPISSSLTGFPPLLLRIISTGEKSGNLAETLHKAASSYEEQFGRKVERLMSLFEPAMILLMGFVVCIIVLAVLLPIFQLNQLVK